VKRLGLTLLSIAATFNSPRYQADPAALYKLFRTSEVIETNVISSVLSISQDGKAVDVVEDAGDLHVDDTSGLKVYVPMDETSQDVCFASTLPLRLADWLMRDSTTQIRESVDGRALTVLTALLGARLSAVDQILDLQGIVRIDIQNQDAQEELGRPYAHSLVVHEEDDAAPERPRTRDSAIPSTNSGSITPATTSHETATVYPDEDQPDSASEQVPDPYPDAYDTAPPAEPIVEQYPDSEVLEDSDSPEQIVDQYSDEDTDPPAEQIVDQYPSSDDSDPPAEHVIVRQAHSASPAPVLVARFSPRPELAPHVQLSAEDIHYRALLNRVLTAARTATLPTRGAYDMTGLLDALTRSEIASFDGLDPMNRFRSSSQIERDKKIGAAGELYVSGPLSIFPRQRNCLILTYLPRPLSCFQASTLP
jgi:hypothetical protein